MKKMALGLGTGLAAGLLAAMAVMNVGAAVNRQTKEITRESAKAAALEHAGVGEDDISYIRVETDYEDGRQVYDVEFFTKDYKEYDYEISAADGSVVSCDYDAETSFRRNRSEEGETASVTEEQAKAAALEAAGVSESQVEYFRMHRDRDDGRIVYEGEFYSGGMEYEFEVDGITGQVTDWDVELY